MSQSLNAAYFLLQDAYAKYVKDYYIGSFGSSVQTYNQKYLKNTTPGEDSADRLWWFQVCTEVAYFQVAPANDSMRSSKVDAKYSSGLHFTDSILLISVFSFFFFFIAFQYSFCCDFIIACLMTDIIWIFVRTFLERVSIRM